jgi:tRNA nucleotidyltransferase (CCA-adding enzyme)
VSDLAAAAPEEAGGRVIAALGELPGGPELLALAQARDDVALVGGAVRDLLLGSAPRELDVALGGEAASFARELASRLRGPDAEPGVTIHERFGTAAVEWERGRVDIAARRAESYATPGALPQVGPGTDEEDLLRRDFTVNALAVPLGGPRAGHLQAPENALDDLAAGRLRVLHDASFRDDPTRLLRLARYAARLGFRAEERTASLAAQALAGDALATVSGARVGAELRLALSEADPLASVEALGELGILQAIAPGLRFDRDLARRALALLPHDGRQDLLLLAQLLLGLASAAEEEPQAALGDLLDALEFPAADRDRVTATVLLAPSLVQQLRAAELPSEVHQTLAFATLEAVTLAGVLAGEPASDGASVNAREWLTRLRHVRLSITGDDLLAAGVPAGPQIGRRLRVALDCRLDGELADGRQAELHAALEARL